jgi:hypothetical protein
LQIVNFIDNLYNITPTSSTTFYTLEKTEFRNSHANFEEMQDYKSWSSPKRAPSFEVGCIACQNTCKFYKHDREEVYLY